MANAKEGYQQLQSELQEVMDWFESGEVDVDRAARQYERGLKIISKLEAHLNDAEIKIEKIKKAYKTKGS